VRLLLNSLGDRESLPAYLDALTSYLRANEGEVSKQSRETLGLNPMRVLDSKRGEEQEVIAGAPVMTDHLSVAAAEHFERVQSGLRTLGIAYELAPRLVRGLDYYTRTTFEFAADALEGAQNAVGGGGRYDGLAEQMGGPPTPGIGFGTGIERILLACDAEGVFAGPQATVEVFVIDVVDGKHALELTHELRAAGISVDRAFDRRSMKAQMKSADRSGASVALIIGEQEAADRTVTVRDLRSSEQESVKVEDVIEHVKKRVQ
jgi:histidyl-tRNA synthetase